MTKDVKRSSDDIYGNPEDLRVGETLTDREHDAVFGDMSKDGPNYRDVGWFGTSCLMMKTQIGLGVLSFPAVFDTLGLIPGAIILCTIAEYVMTAGSAMLSLSISLNALSDHGACTAVFVAVAFVLIFILASIRTLGRITWLAIVGVVCIITAVLTVTIAVSFQDQPPNAPKDIHWESDYRLFGNPSFSEAVSAVSTLIFAYAGTGAFFPIVSEMRDPHLYPRALALCQTVVTVIFLTVGIVVYYYCGSYVASPALGSAGVTIKKVSYGIAFPGLLHLASNSFVHWATWLGCNFGVCLLAYILASAIPVFNGIVSLSGALFGTLLSFQPMGCMWLYDNWARKESPTLRWRLMVAWSVFVIVAGTFMMIAGTCGAVVGIIDSYKADGGSSAWSCADNSNSS
ncbi:transmembrane amino acid transporter [Colletotrichum asianum]|uniref:Transmembrane amino acid transporter n=1 Tax=Colletotrichum asianum TaxID=702518 RepID=A0A8H3WNX2_9PEZI|nr:transmembrane amino acid transporter [Colletotrichum asianum]